MREDDRHPGCDHEVEESAERIHQEDGEDDSRRMATAHPLQDGTGEAAREH